MKAKGQSSILQLYYICLGNLSFFSSDFLTKLLVFPSKVICISWYSTIFNYLQSNLHITFKGKIKRLYLLNY